ncbi:RsmE family RNA methyltransferase [Fibrella aquatilis]|uniref:Ribosomal RNA small subunit methyltransferase E n=1 Tax=Fibrella aquatilis TaxID=2817059 RepID=A0A939JZR0_9BACT|nr:RsmE family RNA methyltransferase [Fibrella aquatilis]MBO0931673.1 16S rRNA (uracil(1498)-N(3))-methyltransferase [Fibrella aquatilis]
MHLFYQPALSPTDTSGQLSDDDARHATRTLRLGPGEAILVTNGRGNRFGSVITRADNKGCAFRIETVETVEPRPFSVRICVAPTKNLDRIEWFVEKAVELGIEQISFFYGQHSERRVLKLERIEKIAVAAMKQSLQSWLPQLDEGLPLTKLISQSVDGQCFIAHLPDDGQAPHLFHAASPTQKYTVLIGPEGDFSAQEVQQVIAAGFQLVTLGPNRLRTETAALSACQCLNLLNVVNSVNL